jgi:hypothetical protein
MKAYTCPPIYMHDTQMPMSGQQLLPLPINRSSLVEVSLLFPQIPSDETCISMMQLGTCKCYYKEVEEYYSTMEWLQGWCMQM